MSGKRVTIKDVAAAANVTAQTVSRVFGSKGYVSEQTRMRILNIAKELNYIPNRTAAALRTGESKKIAVVFDSLCNIYFSIMVDYIHREVQKYGYILQTIFVDSHTINESIYRDALSMGVCAVISFLETEEADNATIAQFDAPLLIFGRRASSELIDYITTDDVQGGMIAAQRLLECGCKNFLFAAEAFDMTCTKDRFSGYEKVLDYAGHKVDRVDCSLGAEQAITEYIKSGNSPDGIFCLSDMIAFGVLKALKKLCVTGVKVIGYDDIQSEIMMPVDLTSVGVGKYEYVAFVVSKLIDKIEGRINGRIAVKVPVRLHRGETA